VPDLWRNNLQSVLAEYDLTLWLLLLAVLLLPIDVGVRRLVMSRRELAEVVAGLPLFRTAPSGREPAVPLVGAMQQRRAERGSLASVPYETRGIRMPGKIEPSLRAPRGTVAPSSSDAPEGETIGARLLAARRKKQ
jgi:hypothetical protein